MPGIEASYKLKSHKRVLPAHGTHARASNSHLQIWSSDWDIVLLRGSGGEPEKDFK